MAARCDAAAKRVGAGRGKAPGYGMVVGQEMTRNCAPAAAQASLCRRAKCPMRIEDISEHMLPTGLHKIGARPAGGNGLLQLQQKLLPVDGVIGQPSGSGRCRVASSAV